MLDRIFVADFYRRDPLSFHAETPISEAIALLQRHRVTGAPVVDRFGALVGFLSEKDVLGLLISDAYLDEFVGTVADCMTRQVVTLDVQDTLLDAAKAFCERPYHVYPVLDQGVLVGTFDRSALIAALSQILIHRR